jgi:hypothetical protein
MTGANEAANNAIALTDAGAQAVPSAAQPHHSERTPARRRPLWSAPCSQVHLRQQVTCGCKSFHHTQPAGCDHKNNQQRVNAHIHNHSMRAAEMLNNTTSQNRAHVHGNRDQRATRSTVAYANRTSTPKLTVAHALVNAQTRVDIIKHAGADAADALPQV